MEQEQLGRGYYRFNLPTEPDKNEAVRINEIFRKALSSSAEDLRIVERFEPSRSFWQMYSDCLHEYQIEETSNDPVIYCKGEDAEFLHTMLGAFRRALKEVEDTSSKETLHRFLPALVNAHLRATVSPDQLQREQRYEKAQSKDAARKLATTEN